MRPLTFIIAVLMVCGGAKLPMPKFSVTLPVPVWTTEIAKVPVVEQVHTAKPTVKPIVLTHSYRGWPGCSCAMCRGQHLRNAHGKTTTTLDRIGYRGWATYHAKLHKDGVAPKPKSRCPGGVCPTPGRRYLFRPWRR